MSRTRLSLVVVAALALSGCTSPTADIAESPAVTQAPTAESDGTASILVTSEKLIGLDDSGEALKQAGYFDDGVAAVELLTNAFGVEPEVSTTDGGPHAQSRTDYVWQGVELMVLDYGSDLGYAAPTVSVTASVDEFEGVAIATRDGISVRDPEDAVKPFSYDYKDVEMVYLLDEFPVDVEFDPSNGPPAYSTHVRVNGLGLVAEITAPERNFGP